MQSLGMSSMQKARMQADDLEVRLPSPGSGQPEASDNAVICHNMESKIYSCRQPLVSGKADARHKACTRSESAGCEWVDIMIAWVVTLVSWILL